MEKVFLDGQVIEVVQRFCCLGDTIEAQGGTTAGGIARVRSGWSKFRELLPLLTSTALPLTTKGRVYQACVRSVMMYGSETWPVRAEDMCCMERNDMRMIRWMCNVSLKDRLRSDELRGRLNLESIGRCVQNRRLHRFGHIERMDKSFWVCRCRAFEVSDSFGRGRPKKTWEEVIKTDLRERRVSKDLTRDRLAWKSIFWKPSNACQHVKRK